MSLKIWLIVVILSLFNLSNACPTLCICKWKNGKQTVECINKDLVIIPDGMDSGTQVLEFTGNNLQVLHREKFFKMDLINLQRIYMSRCRITNIDDRTFKGLTNLVELDLSENLLEVVPSGAFMDCPSLMRLMLNHNPIKTLGKAAFNHLGFLNTLELSNCEISTVEETAFQGLYSLEWLHLNGNKMSFFGGTRHLPRGIKGVQLQENPWECDCHILELHAWLRSFSFPHSVEPVCGGPLRLSGRTIKSVAITDLACLADISPTSFYLEIEEGKNISLLCQVHSVPESKVSWLYQGQLLQNDSMVAPGIHLIYYVEEGTVDKRSELFIYNANTEDNGTFICNAENPAGITQANFTIRIIIKHDPEIVTNEIPFEFILIVTSAVLISTIILVFVLILSIIKCYKNSHIKRKRDNSKEALRNATKENLLHDSTDESELSKDNSNVKLVNQEEAMILYSAHTNEEILRSMSPIAIANQIRSPTSVKCYQAEQNPDLINGTETIGRRTDHLIENHSLATKNNPIPAYNLQPIKTINPNDCNLCMFPSDVHLNPVGLLKTTVVENRSQPFNGNCYRTLPYNRGANKRQSAANPIGRYSREAEFISSRSNQPASYEHYGCDVRYTADGYPVRSVNKIEQHQHAMLMSSSPESHKSISSTSTAEPCCSTTISVQWPTCMPANLHTSKQDTTVIKKCVGAQTQTENLSPNKSVNPNKISNKLISNIGVVNEIVSESPDEGFEGD